MPKSVLLQLRPRIRGSFATANRTVFISDIRAILNKERPL